MATNFPTSLDTLTNPTSSDSLSSPSHSAQHANANDAIEAIETALLDGAPLHIDDANERVGVGNTSPSYALDVTGDINATGDFRTNGTLFYPISYADTTLSATTTPTSYLLSMPTGVTVNNLVSFCPVTGVNNTLTIYYYRLGGWSGNQTTSEILLNCALGNGVHTDPFTIRFYYRV